MKLFLDAACWVAAAGSVTGGSAAILEFARAGDLQVAATGRVLREAAGSIRRKRGEVALARYWGLVDELPIELVGTPSLAQEEAWSAVTARKDCHVLAGALKASADVLVTLDKKHLLTDAVKAAFPIKLQTPGEFLEEWRG